jgi:hypothetical protein
MGIEITLESLGFTKEDLQERVVENLCEQVLHSKGCDEDGGTTTFESTLARQLGDKIEKKLSAIADAFCEQKVGPRVLEYINQTLLTPTDRWGQQKSAPLTFAEYVTNRIDMYLKEKVDLRGSAAGYSSDSKTERGAWLVWQGITAAVNDIIKGSVSQALDTIKGGIEAEIKTSLAKTFATVKVAVEQERR